MEIESLLANDHIHLTEQEKLQYKNEYSQYKVEDLLDLVDGKQSNLNRAQRKIASELVLEKLSANQQYQQEESILYNLSLRELYDVTQGKYSDATDFQINKARELLDDALLRARSSSNL